MRAIRQRWPPGAPIRAVEPEREARYGDNVYGGYRTETFAELVAVATHPDFEAALYPAWVQEAVRLLDELVAARAGS